MTTIYARMTRAELRRRLYAIPSDARAGGTADQIIEKAGTAALSRAQRAFLVKSGGGTDETGARWKPLAPATVAKRLRKREKTKEQERPSSALSASFRELWWDFYRRALWRFKEKDIAARVAWAQIKRLGGLPHYDKYGAFGVPILRDTDALFMSLIPGASHNIFRVKPGEGEFGSDRKGAAAHHKGAKNLPQRRLWPEPRRWTSAWWQDVLEGAREGVIALITEKLQ